MSYKDKELEKNYQKKYQKEHPEKYSEYNRRCAVKRRFNMFILAGGAECKKCGFRDWRALQIDHINGGGSRNRLIPSKLERDIKENPSKYQVLCANCNWIKRYENRESFSKHIKK